MMAYCLYLGEPQNNNARWDVDTHPPIFDNGLCSQKESWF